MPINSPPRKVSETENMLRLLLCVDALDSVTPTQLWTFAAEQELMDYVSMRLCLHKLLAAGEVETGGGSLTEQLILTDRGREALALFGARLPGDIRTRIALSAPEFRTRIVRHQQVRATYEIARANDFRLNLSVYEGDLPTVRLHMETHSRALASRTLHRFPIHAARVTTYLYELAEQAVNLPVDTESEPLSPEAITGHSATEYTANVTLEGKKARFEIELLLPTREASEAFVRRLTQPGEANITANRLTDMVSGARLMGKR
jgi:hypothetical protein